MTQKVIRAIQTTEPETPINLILHTPGGIALAALQIARAIKAHQGKVTVYVPHYAMSGGTLIALAADEIALGEHSVLGPVDPQIDKYPAPSIVNVLKQKPIAEIDDETLILADISQKAINQLNLILGLVVLGLLIAGTFLGYHKRIQNENKNKIETAKEEINKIETEIESVRSINIDTALELAQKAELIISQIKVTDKKQDR